jgi:hypothetical protein
MTDVALTKPRVALFRGDVGLCHWAFASGRMTDRDIDAFVEHIESIVTVTGTVVLEMAHSITVPTPLQRQKITNAVQGIPGKRLLAGHAVATNSMAARGVLTAVNWFVPRTFPEKVFGDPRSAAAWLAEMSPSIDPGRVLAQVAQAVPGFDALRW